MFNKLDECYLNGIETDGEGAYQSLKSGTWPKI